MLGRFAVRVHGEEVAPTAFGGRLVGKLLRVLVARRGEFLPHDVLSEALWPTQMPLDPSANLKALVHRARRVLADPSVILTGPGGYSFIRDDQCVVDAEQFVAWIEEAGRRRTSAELGPALMCYRAALAHWSGEPLAEDLYDDWALGYRSHLCRLRLHALEEAAEVAIALGQLHLAAAWAGEVAASEPHRETGHLLLAQALAAAGDAAAALRVLNALRRRLADELGLVASSAVTTLEGRILRDEADMSGLAATEPLPRSYSLTTTPIPSDKE